MGRTSGTRLKVEEVPFRYSPKGKGIRASAFQLHALNKVAGGLARALRETDASMEHVDADVAWELLHYYEEEGLFTPKRARTVV